MGSTTLTPDMIIKRTMAIASEKAQFVKSINRDYEKEFGKTPKIGDSVRIRMPIDPQVISGRTMPAVIPQYTDREQRLTIDTRWLVPMDFDMADLKLDIDEFTERFIEPSASKVVAIVETDLIRKATIATANYVGTPGTPMNSLAIPLAARTKLNQFLAPKDRRAILLSSQQNAQMVDALKGLFNHQGRIGGQYEEGEMVKAIGFGWHESESIHTHVNGTATNGTVQTTVATNGATTLALAGLGATNTVRAGSVFTIAGVFALHPETKAVRPGVLQQFTVVSDATAAGGNATVTVFPAIYFSPTEQWQNVSKAPTAADVVTWAGAPGSTVEQALAYVKDAFSVAFVDLPKPGGVDFAASHSHDGISLRIVRDYDITEDRLVNRLDVMYGFKAVRPEWACRIAG